MRVLLVLDVAPNYRELFLRKLSKKCDLVVLAHCCEKDNLNPPPERKGYTYIELVDKGFKIRWNFDLQEQIKNFDPDIICVNLNFRYPIRIIDFFLSKFGNKRWLWWGPIFGRSEILNPFKRFLIKLSDGAVVYTDNIVNKLDNAHANALSFHNSQHSADDFKDFPNFVNGKINCLFVGRPQPRKRLDLLFEIAKSREDVEIRLAGPQMADYFMDTEIPQNISLYPAAHGEELAEHFKWSNLVINPGHVGLLVMNAATHCRPIAIGSNVQHAPEVELAKKAGQYFLDFEQKSEVNLFFDHILNKPDELRTKGKQLFNMGREHYTVEYMVEAHLKAFNNALVK
ncbi:MAG: hypothetical protein EA391_00900 [Balneolaceae bacterium]|nr:MAG: hypothetical protein EA391_00900 [Balneolaceae bacterium]